LPATGLSSPMLPGPVSLRNCQFEVLVVQTKLPEVIKSG
jgi:hypothetical protein